MGVKVVVEGDPQEWGRRFTELVCEAWYGRKGGTPLPMDPEGREHGLSVGGVGVCQRIAGVCASADGQEPKGSGN